MEQPHIKRMKEELEQYDALAKVYEHFNYEETRKWTFEKFVELHESGKLATVLGEVSERDVEGVANWAGRLAEHEMERSCG